MPGAYSRCSANSTEKPLCGLLCMPEKYPSTSDRAASERFFSRERPVGSRNLYWTSGMKKASGYRLSSLGFRNERSFTSSLYLYISLSRVILRPRLRHRRDDVLHDLVRRDAFGLGMEVRQDAVAK